MENGGLSCGWELKKRWKMAGGVAAGSLKRDGKRWNNSRFIKY